jgi:dTDP-4-amino-4,6-dideoxygalactose transaminase
LISERNTVLSLPMFAELTGEQIEHVAETIEIFCAQSATVGL